MEALLVVLGAALGAGLTLATGLLQDRLRRRWDRESERQRKAEGAADALLALLDEAADALAACSRGREDPDDQLLARWADGIERWAIQIPDAQVRGRFRGIATCLRRVPTLVSNSGDRPGRVGYLLRQAGHNAAGALLGNEELQDGGTVDTYLEVIADDDRFQDDLEAHNRRESLRRRLGDGGGLSG